MLCLGWKGQCICLEGGEGGGGKGGGGREGGREGGEGGREGGEGGREGGEGGLLYVIHILIGMFNSNPMIPQLYLLDVQQSDVILRNYVT